MIAADVSARIRPTPGSCDPIAAPLAAILDELRAVLSPLTDEQYTARMGPMFSNSTIGGHVRHSLDHARAVVDGRRRGIVDYDHRERGTDIETRITDAAAELVHLAAAMNQLRTAHPDEAISVAIMPTRDGECVTIASTIGRELAFLLSHTIHHNATVRGMVVSLGLPVAGTFGYAPSTIAHQDKSSCAR